MNKKRLSLNQLPVNKLGKVKTITCDGIIRQRLLDLGLIRDTVVKALRRSPAGDPTAYEIRGAVIALRAEDASQIMIDLVN